METIQVQLDSKIILLNRGEHGFKPIYIDFQPKTICIDGIPANKIDDSKFLLEIEEDSILEISLILPEIKFRIWGEK